MSLIQNFRVWWQKPKRTIDLEEERKVGFLELFYDLVYVAIIAELTHALAANVSFYGALAFVFLFSIVWWSWFNGTVYIELHGNNDVRTRFFTFLQMFAVISMSFFAHDALGEGFTGFALSYAAFQLILTFLWWRTGVHDSLHRPLAIPYVAGFLVTTLLFISSIFIEAPYNLLAWIFAVLLSLCMPISSLLFYCKGEDVREELERTMRVRPSLVERFGLFTIIVFGEAVIGVVQGVSAYGHMSLYSFGVAALGLLTAVSMWWIYLDFISLRNPIQKWIPRYAWSYFHLVIGACIGMTGAGIINMIKRSSGEMPFVVEALYAYPIAIFLIAIAVLTKTIQISQREQKPYRKGTIKIILSAMIILSLTFFNLSPVALMLVINLLMLLSLFAAIRCWISTRNS